MVPSEVFTLCPEMCGESDSRAQDCGAGLSCSSPGHSVMARSSQPSEIGAASGKEVRTLLHVLFRRGIESAVVLKEQVVDCNRGHTRWRLHTPIFEKVPVNSVGDEDLKAFITINVYQHNREHRTEEDGSAYAALLHCVRHYTGFGYRPVVSDARHHSVMELTGSVREPLRTFEFLHDFSQSIAIHRVKRFHQTHKGRV
ncbi:unnamed protein product [Dibothriocephalus latus]|uniref:Uncharacterized protein n=1 Tax=Dibothriocephalus latus TaxID=60516 RepID=A0A3P6SSV1_DIBLA|nr:unnamed protein product [Dibothriocephalus latus]